MAEVQEHQAAGAHSPAAHEPSVAALKEQPPELPVAVPAPGADRDHADDQGLRGSLSALLQAPSLAGALSILPFAEGPGWGGRGTTPAPSVSTPLPRDSQAPGAMGCELSKSGSGRKDCDGGARKDSDGGAADGAIGGCEQAGLGADQAASGGAVGGVDSAEQSEEMLEAAASLGSLGMALARAEASPAVSLGMALSLEALPLSPTTAAAGPLPAAAGAQPEANLHSFAAAASALFSQLARDGCVNLAASAAQGCTTAALPATPPKGLPHVSEQGPVQPLTPAPTLGASQAIALDFSPFASRMFGQLPSSAVADEAGAAAAVAQLGASTPAASPPLISLPAPFPATGSITNSPGAG